VKDRKNILIPPNRGKIIFDEFDDSTIEEVFYVEC
jgi:hypothetical protein